jgi:hypothetical protein
MHTAIQNSLDHYQYLTIGSRKPTLKNRLIFVTEGLILIKLGKLEYCVTANQFFWLPANCLCAISYFPNSKVQSVEFSQRIQDNFPTKAGSFVASSLMVASLQRLSESVSIDLDSALLKVIRYEAIVVEPELNYSEMCQAISKWHEPSAVIDKELQLTLKIRAAIKLKQSGKSSQIIADKLFGSDVEMMSAIGIRLIGQKFF